MVSSEVMRARYRNGFTQPEPVPANTVVELTWSLHTQSYTFANSHRIMVQVQSTWFPLIDRNPQTFVRNIFAATDEDFVAAKHRVLRSARHPPHVAMPVVVRGQ